MPDHEMTSVIGVYHPYGFKKRKSRYFFIRLPTCLGLNTKKPQPESWGLCVFGRQNEFISP